jgi:hypothetical protein
MTITGFWRFGAPLGNLCLLRSSKLPETNEVGVFYYGQYYLSFVILFIYLLKI